MLITTTTIVRVSHAGMKIDWILLEKREGPQVRAPNPSMITVMSNSRVGDDFLFAVIVVLVVAPAVSPCDVLSACAPPPL